jgi:putative ABC transport system substrate-binding protein
LSSFRVLEIQTRQWSALKLKLEVIETEADAKGLESAFKTAKQKQVGAIMIGGGRTFFAERKRIMELAGKYRMPAIYPQKVFVDEGGLMSYGADNAARGADLLG